MSSLSKPRQLNIVAMLAAAAAILLIFASAPSLFPPIPPGPIILTVTAALVAFAPGRWTIVIGVLVPLFILIGGIATGGLVDSLNENAGAITGTVLQLIALVTAIAAGARAIGEGHLASASRAC
jgi:hypothetical protein